jgi:hypothetical protein
MAWPGILCNLRVDAEAGPATVAPGIPFEADLRAQLEVGPARAYRVQEMTHGEEKDP